MYALGRVLKYNEAHDQRGRFATSDSRGSGGAPGTSLASYYKKFDQPSITSADIMARYSASERAEVKLAIAKANNAPSSKQIYTDADGQYTPERQELHQQIIDSLLSPENVARATPPQGVKPTFVVLGGRGGSGKSAFTNGTIKEFDAKKFLILDSDAIKEKLRPPYEGWNAASVHEESSDILDTVMAEAKRQGLNVVADTTLRSDHVMRTAAQFKAEGYDLEGHYMFLPRQEAAARAIGRYLSKSPKERGRLVPTDVVLANTENEANFDKLKPMFKKWSAYDNQGDAPKLIARSKPLTSYQHKL